MDWRDVGIRASCQIKRKRKEGADQKEEEKIHPFSKDTQG